MDELKRILLVEDDPEIRSLLSDYLTGHGFEMTAVNAAPAMDQALQRAAARAAPPDLIVLDLMLPGEDGLSICRRLRAAGGPPIIMLTARGEEIDRIVGLEMGADDYLPKPFNPRELTARINAVLRRAGSGDDGRADGARRSRVGPLVIDLDARVVHGADGVDLRLTSAEFDLLICFTSRPNRVLSRDQLMDWTRGRRSDAFDRTIDVQVSRLRKKLEDAGGETLIKTVRSVGYILAAPVAAEDAVDDAAEGGGEP